MAKAPAKGHNNPPNEFEIACDELSDLYKEAKNFLDGKSIKTQGEADSMTKLVKMIKESAKTLEALRVAEAAPHDNAKRAIQDKYAPWIAKQKANTSAGKSVMAIEACNKMLTPWKLEQDRLKYEAAESLRKEAEEAARLAAEAAKGDTLEERENAQELMVESQKLQKASKRTANAVVKGMRTVYKVQMNHPKDAFTHYWNTRRDDILALIQGFAEQEACEAVQTIPGFKITKTKVAT